MVQTEAESSALMGRQGSLPFTLTQSGRQGAGLTFLWLLETGWVRGLLAFLESGELGRHPTEAPRPCPAGSCLGGLLLSARQR